MRDAAQRRRLYAATNTEGTHLERGRHVDLVQRLIERPTFARGWR